MIDLLSAMGSLDAKTANDNWRLANLNHTVDMTEAESKVPVVYEPVKRPGRVKDLTGMRLGRWTVLELLGGRRFSECNKVVLYYRCKCVCGTEKDVSSGSLKKNGSCGCAIIEATKISNSTHGLSKSSEYGIWAGIKYRCLNSETKEYRLYGGRGITICERWKNSFENFLEDMGRRPSDDYSIERKNVNGNYEPDNCIWATQKEQMRNYRRNLVIQSGGETKCLVEWSEKVGIKPSTISKRLKSGWDVATALSKPVRLSNRTYQ